MTQTLTLPAFVEMKGGIFYALEQVATDKSLQKSILWDSYSSKEQRDLKRYLTTFDN